MAHPIPSSVKALADMPLQSYQRTSPPQQGASATAVALSHLDAMSLHATPKPQDYLATEAEELKSAIELLNQVSSYFEKAKAPQNRETYLDLVVRSLNLFMRRHPNFGKDILKSIEVGLGTKSGLSSFTFTHENRHLLFDIKSHLGKPLLQELISHCEKRYELVSSLHNINTFITIAERPDARIHEFTIIQQTSSDFQKKLKDQFFKGQNIDSPNALAKALFQYTPKASIIEFSKTHIESQIVLLRSEKFNQISINPRQAHEDQLSYDFQVKINQIRELQRLLSEGSSEEIETFFQEMDSDVKGAFCEAIWVIDGKPLGNPQYGQDAIRSNPYKLLKVMNEKGQNIVSQLENFYLIKRGILPVLNTAQTVHQILSKAGALTVEDHDECLRLIFASEPIRSFCESKIWLRDRQRANQESNPDFGGWEYGKQQLIENPRTILDTVLGEFISVLTETSKANVHEILENLPIPSSNVNQLARKINAAAVRSVALISCEFKGIVSQGGLGEAVLGMAKGLKAIGLHVTMILPKYDVIPDSTNLEDTTYRIHNCAVFKCQVNEVECLLIEDPIFQVGMTSGKANSIYGGKDVPNGHDAHVKARFARFQNLAADLGHRLFIEKKIELLHVQDSQTALVPRLLEKYYQEDWKKGLTPPVVFTFHNNLHGSQGRYGYGKADELPSMEAIGLGMRNTNSFTEGLEYSDAATTVSAKFAEEAQSNGELGRDVGFAVRKAALQGKLFDVLNGTSLSVDFDPKQNKVLKNWQLVECLTFPESAEEVRPILMIDPSESLESAKEKCERFFREIDESVKSGKKVMVDLSYGLDDHPLYIYAKKRICKIQVAHFMSTYGHGTINPDQPLLLNIGRFDSFQKGIGKIPFIMEAAKKCGAQLISIGLDGESCADIPTIRKTCSKFKNDGLILIEDERVPGGIKWQMGHKGKDDKKVPGIGPVLRAAADMGVFPSSFEPCGLVQGECFNFGCRVLATDTGGFHDTVFSSGDKANGWLFPRLEAWNSDAQLQAIETTLRNAVDDLQTALYLQTSSSDSESDTYRWQLIHAFHLQSKKIMADAKCAGWADTPSDGSLNPAQKLQHVYARAIENSQRRDISYLDLLHKFS
jgi:glycogen synthase